jgi:hypothetical protein
MIAIAAEMCLLVLCGESDRDRGLLEMQLCGRSESAEGKRTGTRRSQILEGQSSLLGVAEALNDDYTPQLDYSYLISWH